MRTRRAQLFIILLLALSGAGPNRSVEGYWFWAGQSVLTPPVRSGYYYIHQGTLERSSSKTPEKFVAQGAAPVKTSAEAIYLVFRIEALEQEESLAKAATYLGERWEVSGNTVLGFQIDYDSPTEKLEEYSAFLQKFRALIPERYRLSVTGLADWAANASEENIQSLAGSADEIVFQLYNGRRPIPHLESYLRRLRNMSMAFRLGLLEGMPDPLTEAPEIRSNPNFQGFVYFLLPEQRKE